MDLSKLGALSTEGLMKLQEAIQQVLDGRVDRSLVRGRTADFTDKQGNVRTITIARINQQSVSGSETATSKAPGSKWRVSKSSLRVHPKIKPGAEGVKPFAPSHRPVTYGGDHW